MRRRIQAQFAGVASASSPRRLRFHTWPGVRDCADKLLQQNETRPLPGKTTGGVRGRTIGNPSRIRRGGRGGRRGTGALVGETLAEIIGDGVRTGDVQFGRWLRGFVEHQGRAIGFVPGGSGGVRHALLHGRGDLEDGLEGHGEVVVLAKLGDIQIGRDQLGGLASV